jgi:hypothetical protein
MVDPIVTPVFTVLSSIASCQEFHAFTKSVMSGIGKQVGREIGNGFSSSLSNQNSIYQKAFKEYWEKDLTHRKAELQTRKAELEIREAELQAQKEFGQKLLQWLWESHKQTNDTELHRIQNDWDKDNWFSKLDRRETEQILKQAGHRLLVLASFPSISRDCPDTFENNLDKEIRNQLARILGNNYSQFSPINPVQFYGDYFKDPVSDIDVRRLHSILQGLPTVVLYSDITDYEVNFNLGIWGSETQGVLTYRFPEWNWEESYQDLQKQGKSEQEALREIRKTIVDVYVLLSIFISDWYYLLINPFYEPQFEKLTANLSLRELETYINYLNELYLQNKQEIARQKELLKTQENDKPPRITWTSPTPSQTSHDDEIGKWKRKIQTMEKEREDIKNRNESL